MTYALLRRTRDAEDGIVHLKDPKTTTLALCEQGFAASTLDMAIKNTAVPTCVFCISGGTGFPHWRLGHQGERSRVIVDALRAAGLVW